MRKIDETTVNDGKGLYDNEGICDKGIVLCNDALKCLVSGQYVAFTNRIQQITQIFANLKNAVKNDRESLEQKVEDLKRENKLLEEQLHGLQAENNEGGAPHGD